MENKIVNLAVTETCDKVFKEGHYKIELHKIKNKYLRKFAFWIQKKLEGKNILSPVYQYQYNYDVKHIEIDLNKFEDMVMEQMYEFGSQNRGLNAIMIGRDQFRTISRQDSTRNFLTFQANISLRGNPCYYFEYVKIIVNPLMDGIVFIPDDIL